MSKEFNEKTILETIAEYVTEHSNDDGIALIDIHDYASFNSDPWIKGKYRASEALKDFNEQDQLYKATNLDGVFGAIEYVQFYEIHQYDEVLTNLLNPEKVASMVAFINGEQIITELSDRLNINLFDELTKQQLKQLSSVETMQKLLY